VNIPLVTFYVPVYNGARYLREALDSILAQTVDDWECIVVDDHSTDESPAILASYADPRLRVVRQPVNLNVANASNLALRLARGKYLARLDQDDIAEPTRLAEQAAFLEAHPEASVCSGAMLLFGHRHGVAALSPHDGVIKARLLTAMDNIANPASMVRTEFLRANFILNDPRFPYSCDYVMWIDCTLAGARFSNVPGVVTRYRIHEEQSSRHHEELHRGVISGKTRLLQAWFPDFSYAEILALEPLLRANSRIVLSPEAARRGVELCARAMDPGRASVHGEDRNEVAAFLRQRRDEWQAHLVKG
jgi:glycosyltransferase involved in cell wall biosynthesis